MTLKFCIKKLAVDIYGGNAVYGQAATVLGLLKLEKILHYEDLNIDELFACLAKLFYKTDFEKLHFPSTWAVLVLMEEVGRPPSQKE